MARSGASTELIIYLRGYFCHLPAALPPSRSLAGSAWDGGTRAVGGGEPGGLRPGKPAARSGFGLPPVGIDAGGGLGVRRRPDVLGVTRGGVSSAHGVPPSARGCGSQTRGCGSKARGCGSKARGCGSLRSHAPSDAPSLSELMASAPRAPCCFLPPCWSPLLLGALISAHTPFL